MMCGVVLAGSLQATPPPAPAGMQLEAVVIGAEPGGTGNDALYRTRIARRGAAMRVDLAHPSMPAGYLIESQAGQQGWFVLSDIDQVLPASATTYRELWVDPREPCKNWPGHCARTTRREVAGREVQGWRVRNARDRGPGGMSQGELWVDEEWGLVLGYRGTTGRGRHAREMHVLRVEKANLPDTLFELAAPDDSAS